MTSVEHFVEALAGFGVEWMATLCGHGLDPLFHAAQRAGMRLVDTRNEQTAAYIAESWGRLSRRPGVCCVSSGVAHANALTGLMNAWFGGSPMLLVSGAGAHRTAGMGHFQDVDQAAMAVPITRFSRVLDHPDRTLEVLHAAWNAAARGPAHITYPMDVQNAAPQDLLQPVPRTPPADAEDPDAVAAALDRSERPLIVAGNGVYYRNSGGALLAAAERARIPVVTPIWDRGIADRPSPAFLGVIGAASGGPGLLDDADCVIMAGAAPDYRVGFLHRKPAALWLTKRWSDVVPARTHDAWLAEAQRRRDEFRASVRARGEEQARSGFHALQIVDTLRELLPPDGVLLIDGGSIGQWAHQLLCDRYPGHWLTCGPSGVVGFGIGGAMAARLAYPDRAVVLLSGDGAFTFNVAELECAARQKLPFVAIVADDLGWGITRTGHLRQFGAPIASSLGPIAFDRLADALGARGRRAETPQELRRELSAALGSGEVTVIHAPIVGGNP